jgi:hypothetical protein
MKYKILDKVNNEYLDLTKYCVNGFGDVMTISGLVMMNQNDFEIQMEVQVVLEQDEYTDYNYCGVYGTKEKAQERIDEIVKDHLSAEERLYIQQVNI